MRVWFKAAAFLLGAPLVVCCAERSGGRWENPNVAEEQWTLDQAECRKLASDEAEREYALRQQEGPRLEYDPNAPLVSSMARFDAAQRREDLFEGCMTERGYRRVPPPSD